MKKREESFRRKRENGRTEGIVFRI